MTRHLKTPTGMEIHCEEPFHRTLHTFRIDECDCEACLVAAYDATIAWLARIADRRLELEAAAELGGAHVEA